MIVFDENIIDQDVIDDLNRWYKGKVASIKHLRIRTLVKDDSIPSLLRTVKQPTFITTNVSDFWRKMPACCALLSLRRKLPAWARFFKSGVIASTIMQSARRKSKR